MLHRACGPSCALLLAVDERQKQERKVAKAERAETKKKLDCLRPRKWYVVQLKIAMHAWVRARDEGKPCISCDTVLLKLGRPGGDYDAGHLRSVGSAKHLEFDERNIHGQCKHCNDYKAGNPQEYERRLRLRVGDAEVDALLADQDSRKYSIDDFIAMTEHYRKKLKELQNNACM